MMVRLSILLLLVLLSIDARAQFVCGSTNVFEKDIAWMREFARSYGFASVVGSQESQCGMMGEDFKLCRKCESGMTGKQIDILQPMLSSPRYRTWIDRWRGERERIEVRVTPTDFDAAVKMGHVRPAESRRKFEIRNNENWGESYFFFHRELYKMIQLELTLNGQSCLAPRASLPPDWNDKEWPVPQGRAAIKELEQLKFDIATVMDPSNLKKLTLNQLGDRAGILSAALARVYRESDANIRAKCQGDELVSKTCDDLTSSKSSQANKHYWLIHSYMDSMVGSWLKANDFEEIAKDCRGKKKCYQWQGTYTATYPF